MHGVLQRESEETTHSPPSTGGVQDNKPDTHEATSLLSATTAQVTESDSTSEQALLQAQGNYTLQLLASVDVQAVKEFTQRHSLQGKVMMYHAYYKGKIWYVVLYGTYPTKQQAQVALQQLPAPMKALHPWIKPLRMVKKEIRLGRIV